MSVAKKSVNKPAPTRREGLGLSAVAAAIVLLSGCASLETPKTAAPAPAATTAAPAATPNFPGAAASAPAGTAAAAKPPVDPSAPKPFAEVSKGATQQDGLFPIWRKDDKVWIEIPKAMLNKPVLFTVNIANSVGERGLYASQMGSDWMAEFRLVGKQVQLIALNTKFRAVAEQGSKRAIEQAFSPSLLGSGAVASAEHPERKSVLVDAGFLLSDIPGYSTRLEMAYRLPYAIDRANSSIESSRAEAALSTLTARIHFATPRIPAPPLVPAPSPVPPPTPPQSTPDPRSFFVDYVYSFAALPETPMAVRHADPRLGHFMESFTDLGGDLKANPRLHYVQRWRLEKQDPTAALSEPVKPITFWMDKNIPVRYRPAVEAGIVEWNKAFEKIGFKNAVVAKQQPDDANWDNMDAGHASIRWFVGADVGFAIGPSHTDPRSGEILDADIGMSDVFARGSRRMIVEDVGLSSEQRLAQLSQNWQGLQVGEAPAQCHYAQEAAAEMNFALDLLEARGDIAPDSPEAEAFVQAVIKDTIMHEVGHTLGLKHNFKASTTITREQLKDKALTEAKGISGSVMDYNAYNLALKGETQAAFNNSTLGAYDYWAIEYAYKPIAPEQEKAELARIAARSTEPALAYADDADAGGFGPYDGLDPMANRFDLGDDPLAYYKKRLQLSQELWTRVQDRKPEAGDDPLRQRRALLAGFNQLYRAAELVGKYVGGMHALRDLPGSTGRPAFQPVEPAKQREALQFLSTGLFSESSFRFRPELLANLTLDYNEWERGVPVNLSAAVARVQLVALDRLLSANTATRLLDTPAYLAPAQRKNMISLNEVYATVQGSVWSELKSGAEIDRLRRNLQREHLKRLQTLLTRGSASLPPDALSLLRYNATRLQAELRQASGNGALSVESRAHLAESLGSLTEALRATMTRS
ncbi:zinc-dependent metalloprotease [Paucibacter sp. PLA-PC-4]|uniref:zinc-dependent metalloprotease n=1 Tax=Paucibacter sp. PLA-PC-4 TaxID=2993655 RepID=UPI002248FF0C|nr:zinc-dependent metalloprotease [Paucibacter sp. PLA-PC-4]MCX2861308.1 zinc-dependent metalloprotease [Paucibacter sp. PLA-PC-4]